MLWFSFQVNYDCDLAAANIFERLVDILSKIAQGRQAFELGASPAQLRGIRLKGLECLVNILKCMVEWSKDLYVNPHAKAAAASRAKAANGNQQQQPNSLTAEELDSVKAVVRPVGDDPSQYEKVKQYKLVLEAGMKLFKQKPNKGIKFMQEKGIIDKGSMVAVAQFLHSESTRLDKTAIGEFLGEVDNKQVMYFYVDEMNYNGMGFVTALRHFLEGFRLPGESQVRIITCM